MHAYSRSAENQKKISAKNLPPTAPPPEGFYTIKPPSSPLSSLHGSHTYGSILMPCVPKQASPDQCEWCSGVWVPSAMAYLVQLRLGLVLCEGCCAYGICTECSVITTGERACPSCNAEWTPDAACPLSDISSSSSTEHCEPQFPDVLLPPHGHLKPHRVDADSTARPSSVSTATYQSQFTDLLFAPFERNGSMPSHETLDFQLSADTVCDE